MARLAPTPEEWSAILLSIEVGALSVLLALVPGVAIGWLLARRRFVGKSVLDAVVHLPIVAPPVVTGYLLLLLLGRNRPVGRWLADTLEIDVAFTFIAAVLAAAVMGFPLFVRAVRLSIESADRGLENAAGTLGASPWRVFRTITLPLALPGVVTGGILCFARSLGEFGATITFAGDIEGETRTIPLAIFGAMQRADGDGPAMRLTVISLILSLAALVASEALARRVRARLGGRR